MVTALTGYDLTEQVNLRHVMGLRVMSQWALAALWQMPLASAGDLAGFCGRDRAGVYRDLRELEVKGLASGMQLGYSKRRQLRWHLTEMGCQLMWEWGVSWNTESGLCQLLDRMPRVEWFYGVAAEALGVGRVKEFVWLDAMSVHAAARSEDGWVALIWSGSWETEFRLRARFESLVVDLDAASVGSDRGWPGLFCWVVSDFWQRELVLRVARSFNMLDRVAVWCTVDGSRFWRGGGATKSGLVVVSVT